MLISTKGRYALRVMIDLAEHQGEGFIPLKVIAQRQEISEKYLESIIKLLVKSRLLIGVRGKGGGYQLTKAPDQCTVGAILRLTEDSLAPVACLEPDADTLDKIIEETLSAVSSERTSRVIDSDGGAASMEKRKREGYF